ncbi:Gfo/Idh/MocA family oxidoreductase [Namhaeicola litoreus]|uniref:Gfo/Idh/MocA family oxidoreductase n=1 Tax=Namhaeicola litoreus TaxID=1052145 RepID=A0ABW3XZX1_9FLAO
MQTIQTALCSFGMSGMLFHAPFIDVHPKFQLKAVLERTNRIAHKKYPEIQSYSNLDELLADDDLELVIVNTPNITHFEYAKKVIQAGKHLVVEKPFTATVHEAEELIALADKYGVKLSVYHNRRYDSGFRTAKKVLEKSLLGELVDVEMHFDRYVPELSYKVHKETPTPAVGNLYDLGSHLIDQSLVLFGMPHSVYADFASHRPNSKVIDYFDVKLFYESHKVTLKSSYFVREPLPGNIFHGKKGSFIKSNADVQEKDLQSGKIPSSPDWGIEPENERGLLHAEINGKVIKEYIPTERGDYMRYYDQIYNSIREGMDLPVTGLDGLKVIKVIEAAIKSNTERKVIDLKI